jgi:hypothetical protein
VPTKKPKKPEVREIATTGKDIDIFAGYINRLENPDPVLRTEAGGKGLKLYDEVDRDAHAGSVLQTRYLAVVGKEWNIEPARAVPGIGRPATARRASRRSRTILARNSWTPISTPAARNSFRRSSTAIIPWRSCGTIPRATCG